MKICKKRAFLACMLVLLMSFGFCLPFLTKAVSAATTTYTVRVFSGERGNFSGKSGSINEVKVFSGLTYGSEFSFRGNGLRYDRDHNSVTLTDQKYYVRGFRESGKDNSTVGLESFKVTRDIDYVVAYGVAGSTVEYYVNYIDEDGNTLAPSETYYGNVGDKPVVAYLYIDGYFPQARNLTGTLKADSSKNNFTFVYRPIETPSSEETTAEEETTTAAGDTETTQTPGQTTTIERIVIEERTGTGGNTTATGTEGADATPAGDNDTDNADNTDATEAEDGRPTSPDEVPDLIDIDDEDTPLADFEGASTGDQGGETGPAVADEGTGRDKSLSLPARIGLGIVFVAVIAAAAGALYFILIGKPGKSEDSEESEDSGDSEDKKETPEKK